MGSLSFPAPAGRSTAFCKWLLSEHARGNSIKRAANNWNGTLCESSLAVTWASVWFEGARSECKRQMNCLCFPFCLFKYWNTKSFRREIIQGSQSKWDSLCRKTEHTFFFLFSNPCMCVCVGGGGCFLRYKRKACWDWFLRTTTQRWCAAWKYTQDAERSNWVFIPLDNVMRIGLASCLRSWSL